MQTLIIYHQIFYYNLLDQSAQMVRMVMEMVLWSKMVQGQRRQAMMSQGLESGLVRLHHQHKNAIHMNVRGTLCIESGVTLVFEVGAEPYNTGSTHTMEKQSLYSHGIMASWGPSTMGVPRTDRPLRMDRVQFYASETGLVAVAFGM